MLQIILQGKQQTILKISRCGFTIVRATSTPAQEMRLKIPETFSSMEGVYLISSSHCSGIFNGWVNFSNALRYIVQAVVEDIIKHAPNLANLNQLVLMGESAGAYGVGFNCDMVADRFFH